MTNRTDAIRAWSRQLARSGAPATVRKNRGAVWTERVEELYKGFFAFERHTMRPEKFDGTEAPDMSRELFVGFDAAIVLPYDPIGDQVVLVEQFRTGPKGRGDPQAWTLEAIAGIVDPGETPEASARREAVEEAGLELISLEKAAAYYTSPGNSTDFYHCFLGLCDLSEFVPGIAGVATEHEDIRSHLLSYDEAMALAASGEANVGPLLVLLYWLAHHRARLRAA